MKLHINCIHRKFEISFWVWTSDRPEIPFPLSLLKGTHQIEEILTVNYLTYKSSLPVPTDIIETSTPINLSIRAT